MASRTVGSEKELREFWDSFPRDAHGNIVIQDYARDEDLPGVVDPEIQAINDLFREKLKAGELALA